MYWCWVFWEIGKSWSRFIEVHGGRDEAAIRKRCPDGRQEVGSEPSLNDIAESARIEGGAGVVGVFMDCDEDNAGGPLRAPELARRFDTVEPRHGDVEHDDIRMKPLRLSKEFASIAHSTDDQTLAGRRLGRQRERRLMTIGQQHARAFRRARIAAEGSFEPRLQR